MKWFNRIAIALSLVATSAFAQINNPGAPGNVVAGNNLSQSGNIIGVAAPVTVANGGTNVTSASGTALDNITGFSSTGYLKRTGAGAYSFVLPIPISDGGTGATSQSAALTALLGSSIIPIANGGTNSSTALGATSNIQFQATATGAVARSVAAKLGDVLNFADFGGVCNGVANDDAAFTKLTTAIVAGTRVEFPAGNCTFTQNHTYPLVSGVTLEGTGSGTTTFTYTGAATNIDLMTVGNGSTSLTGWNIRGISFQSNTKMTAGAALHLERMQNGNQMTDVNFGTFGSSSNNLYNGAWLDNVNVFKYDRFNISVQNQGLMMNGSQTSAEGSDIFLDNGAVTFSSIGYHTGGGQGGVYFGKVLAYGNGVNYQFDNLLSPQENREIFFSDQSVSDGSSSYGVWFNDSATSNAPVVMNGAYGSAGLIGPVANIPEIYIQKWPNGRISFGPGQLYNATGDGLKIDDSSVQIAIDPSRFIFNNTGYGINATAANANIANSSQFMYSNTAGNYSSNVQPLPFAVTSNVAINYKAGSQAGFYWKVGGNNRWVFQTDGSAETGSNAGSNALFSAYSDTGVYINSWMQINRANGAVTFPGNILANSGTVPAYQANGTIITSPHAVVGYVSLASGAATVTLTAPAAYTNNSSYTCTAADNTGANSVFVSQASGTSFTLSGTGTDLVRYSCMGD